MELLDVVVHLDYAFDVGYEIDLDRAQDALARRRGNVATPQADAGIHPLSPSALAGFGHVAAPGLPGGLATVRSPRDFVAVRFRGRLTGIGNSHADRSRRTHRTGG